MTRIISGHIIGWSQMWNDYRFISTIDINYNLNFQNENFGNGTANKIDYSKSIYHLNLNHHSSIKKDFKDFAKLNTRKEKTSFIQNRLGYLFGSSHIATAYIHELAHAWRSINEGFHDRISLTINGKTDSYEFDAAATTVFQNIIQFGLFDFLKWFTFTSYCIVYR